MPAEEILNREGLKPEGTPDYFNFKINCRDAIICFRSNEINELKSTKKMKQYIVCCAIFTTFHYNFLFAAMNAD